MAVIDSTVLGYLAPTNVQPPDYDQAMENIFQQLCVGITGIQGSLVRPRWQTWPGNTPDQESLWVSFGLAMMARQWDAYVTHDPNGGAGAGESSVSGSETWECNYSFYGLTAEAYAAQFRDGMALAQNRDVLSGKGIKFQFFAEPINLPALVKNTWMRRVDLKGTFTRLVTRTYSVRNLLSANVDIDNERYHTVIKTP